MAKHIDLTGQTFDRLSVVGKVRTQNNGAVWLCRCTCGGTAERLTGTLRRAKRSGCDGCRAAVNRDASDAKWTDLVGQTFGDLTVIGATAVQPNGTRWLCQCRCGEFVSKLTGQLTRPGRKACRSCEPRTRSASCNWTTHGENALRPGRTRLYRIWKGMRSRCADVSNPYYGGRGIAVAAVWDSFPAFKSWALSNGYADDLSIDRVNNDGGYSPGNCRWATDVEQMANRRVSKRA